MTQRPVSDAASLTAALKVAQGGDVLLLAPGAYAGLALSGLSFDPPVTITSADPSQPAVLANFTVTTCKGLSFVGLDLAVAPGTNATTGAPATNMFGVIVKGSDRIAFDRVSVHGSLDEDPANDPSGIQVLNSTNVSLTNSELQQLGRGAAFGTVANLTVANNRVHGIRSDGFDFAEVSFVTVADNRISDFHPVTGDHPDAIQFWTQGTKTPSHDITIRGNLIERGESDASAQGIFMGDETGVLHFQNVVIAENLIVGTGLNALRINGVDGLSLTGNELVTFAGQDKTYPLVQHSSGLSASGNRAVLYGGDLQAVQAGNTVTTSVTDGGAAARSAWLATHSPGPASNPAPQPEPEPQPDPVPPAPPPPPADDPRITALIANRWDALALVNQAVDLGLKARKARAKNQYIDQMNVVLPQAATLLGKAL